MRYSEIVRLTVIHEYYGNDSPPLRLEPFDPHSFERAGLLIRQTRAETIIAAEEGGEGVPDQVDLVLLADEPDVVAVTRGVEWNKMAEIALPLGVDDAELSEEGPATAQAMARGRRSIARIRLAIDTKGLRTLTVRFQAEAPYWAYHVTGPGIDAPLEISDPDGTVDFEDLGKTSLTVGRVAKVLRSTEPISSRARSPQRFSLQRPGSFGPEILIPVLPAAAPPFKTMPGDKDASPRLQSDIFVSLF